jgi:nucleoside-diphosphate-sugar epimerase
MILVTGGTGLLGSHLLFDLVSKGEHVRAIKRPASRIDRVEKVFSYYCDDPGALAAKIEWVNADLLDFGAVEEAMQGVKEVFHCGAIVSFYPNDHKKMLKVNIEGTANLVNQALAGSVEKFCYVSSVATLGRTENQEMLSEESYWVPSNKNSVYSISKYSAEREVWRGMEEGLKAVIINPSVILGPGFWQDNSGLFRLVYEGLKYYTVGMNGYVDARDVSAAMILLMEEDHFGQRYICSAENIAYRDLFAMMAKHLNKPAPSVRVSPAMSSVAWRVEALRSALTGSKPEITREMAVTASQTFRYTSEKLCNTLDFRFRPVGQSVMDICNFYLADLKST